jgi:hypothetical protein
MPSCYSLALITSHGEVRTLHGHVQGPRATMREGRAVPNLSPVAYTLGGRTMVALPTNLVNGCWRPRTTVGLPRLSEAPRMQEMCADGSVYRLDLTRVATASDEEVDYA